MKVSFSLCFLTLPNFASKDNFASVLPRKAKNVCCSYRYFLSVRTNFASVFTSSLPRFCLGFASKKKDNIS